MLVHTRTWIIQKYTFGTAVSEVPPSVAWVSTGYGYVWADHQQRELHGDKKYILKPQALEKKDNFYQSMYLPRVEL